MGTQPVDAGGDGAAAHVRRVQPYQALKTYLCPGCNHQITPRTMHLVVIPNDAPDLRRHWHEPCWNHRGRRRPGR